MTTLSTNTIISLIDTRTNNGIINLPKTTDIQNRTLLFKDIYGSFNTKSLTLQTQNPDVFEDGTTVKTFNDPYTSFSLYADSQNGKWLQLYGTQVKALTVSSINGLSSITSSNAFISSLTVTNLTFAPGSGWVNIVALQTVLTSSIQTDTAILNASSLRGDGSQIYNINAISTPSLTSTIVGLGTVGYVSSSTLQSTVRGLGSLGYLSSLQYISSLIVSTASLSVSTINFIDINTKIQQQLLVSSGVLTLNGAGVGSGSGGGTSGLTISDYVCGGVLLTNQTIVSGVDTNVTFSDDFDPRNWYNTGTNRFQPTIAGYYEINYQVWWQNGTVNNNQYNIQINKNGLGNQVAITQTEITTTTGLTQNISKIVYLNGSTDYLLFTVYNGNPGSVVIQSGSSGSGTFFSASLLTNGSTGEPLYSTVQGLGTVGYISSPSLYSSIAGLGTVGYVSSSTLQSTIIGLGTLRYVSTASLFSSIQSYNFVSTSSLQSTVVGLGTVGYVSSSTLQSTIIGLGTLRYVSTASLFSSIQSYNFVSTSSLQSTVVGLGTVGYISSPSLYSSIAGLGTVGYVSSSTLQSTIIGLGTLRYVSTASLFSSIQSYNFVSTSSLQSTVVGLGTVGYISSPSLYSSIAGLGTVGYVSSSTLQSSIIGLGTLRYVSTASLFSSIQSYNFVSTSSLQSTVVGLGTVGFISSPSLYSSIAGLGTVGYVSSSTLQSTIIGLGTLGYISSAGASQGALTSSIVGLGTVGYLSSFNGSTNFLSSGNAFISSLTVGNLTFAPGSGWVNIVALQTVLTSSIQTDTAILNASSLRGDGSQIYNINAISTLSLQSTLTGLGSLGYISSAGASQGALTSSIIGLGTFGYVSSSTLQSTIVGLGTLGYISSAGASQGALTSSLIGLGTFGYVSSLTLQSTIIGLGTLRYVSTASLFSSIQSYNFVSTSSLQSTVIGLGTVGYVSSLSLYSSIAGLGTVGYVSSSTLQSTIIGLGTLRYVSTASLFSSIQSYNFVSTSSLQSTVIGLGTVGYVSSLSLYSSIAGLGTVGYVSSTQLESSIIGLGTFGYVSSSVLISSLSNWSIYAAKSTVDLSFNNITNVNQIKTFTSLFGIPDSSDFTEFRSWYGGVLSYSNLGDTTFIPIVSDWSLYSPKTDVDMGVSTIFNVGDIIPASDDVYNLGTSTNRWHHLFVGGASIYMGNNSNFGVISVSSLTSNTNVLKYNNEIIGGPSQLIPQIFDFGEGALLAPVIDWANCSKTGTLRISWFPVEGATAYKVFYRTPNHNWINSFTENDTTILRTSLTSAFFDSDSGLLYTTSYTTSLTTGNYFVYAYKGSVRSETPLTQIFYNTTGLLELWPVIRETYIGGSNFANFTSCDVTNLYTNETLNVLSNDIVLGGIYEATFPRFTSIHTDTYIYQK